MDKENSSIPREKSEQELKMWFESNVFQNSRPEFDTMRYRYLNKLGIGMLEKSFSGVDSKSTLASFDEEALGDKKPELLLPKTNSENLKKNDVVPEEKENLKKIEEKANELFSINFLTKSDSEIREKYLNTLINKKILNLEPSKKHQSSNFPYCFCISFYFIFFRGTLLLSKNKFQLIYFYFLGN